MLQGQHRAVMPWPPKGWRKWGRVILSALFVAAFLGSILSLMCLAGCATVTKPSPVEAAAAAGGKAEASGANAVELHGMLGAYVQPAGKALWEGLGKVLTRWTSADAERTAAEAKLAAENAAKDKRIAELLASDSLKRAYGWAAFLLTLGGGLLAIAGLKLGRNLLPIGSATFGLGLLAGGLYYLGKTLMVLTIGGVGAVLLYGLVLLAVSVAHQMRSHQMILTDAIAAAMGREATE